MKKETDYARERFEQAVATLKQGVEIAKDELGKDGVIQRFEYCFELLWKTLKVFLEDKGTLCQTPKDCLKAAFRLGFLKDEGAFLDMLTDRNKTSHLYQREESEKIFQRIKKNYLIAFEEVLPRLGREDGENFVEKK